MGIPRWRADRRRFGISAAAGGSALTRAVFSLRNVIKSYAAGGTEFHLSIPHLDIPAAAKLAFVGESGCGKSTVLELLAMILRPTRSEAFIFCPPPDSACHDVAAAWTGGDADYLTDLRSSHVGFVLQTGGLLPYLTVRENINLSRRLLHLDLGYAAEHWADKLQLAGQLDKLPAALSVGQRQRVAIARAVAHQPTVLIADEPTAAVDPLNAERIMVLLAELVDELGVALIVASHAHGLMERAGLRLIQHRIDAANDGSMRVTVSDVE